MSNTEKRITKKGQFLYVIDCWGTTNGMQAFQTSALVIEVDEKTESFTAVLYGDTYQRYSMKDFGRIIFDTEDEAETATEKLPKPGVKVYVLNSGVLQEKIVKGVIESQIEGFSDLVIKLIGGEVFSIKEIGNIILLSNSVESVKV